jgi:hypothetical protein
MEAILRLADHRASHDESVRDIRHHRGTSAGQTDHDGLLVDGQDVGE